MFKLFISKSFKYLSKASLALFMAGNTQARNITPNEFADIDRLLAESEAEYSDIIEQSRKSVRWFNGHQKTALSIIYLHGFSASSKELSPVTERLADQLGANVYYARLTGHARSSDAMTDGSVERWQADAQEAYAIGSQIGEQVILVSASTGGTLATWLLAQPFAQNIVTNIMVSPNYGLRDRMGEMVRWPWGLSIVKWVNGDYHSFEPQNELHTLYWTERYQVEALVPMIHLVDNILAMDKSRIEVPQLIIYSPDDRVISVPRINKVVAEFSASDVTLSEFKNSSDPSQHVLAGDAVAPASTDDMVTVMLGYIQGLGL